MPFLDQIFRSKITTEAAKKKEAKFNESTFKRNAGNGNTDTYGMKSAATIYQMCL